MSFSTAPIDVANATRDKIIDPRDKKTLPKDNNYYQWWMAETDQELCAQVLSTTAFLKNLASARIRQASLFSRLYSGKPLYNYMAATSTMDNSNQMPMGRPTANVVYSCSDTLTSMITQERPRPVFLTDDGSYKEQRIAKQMNRFIMGEFYRCQAYDIGTMNFRDSCIIGDGLVKIVEKDKRVGLERTLATELLVDFNDGYYGKPRGLIHTKLCDRGMFVDLFPKAEAKIMGAIGGTVDNSQQSTETVSDQFIISEAWHLPSGKNTRDGRHVFICSEGVIFDDRDFDKEDFPFTKLGYNPNTVGYFSQGLAEILFPTQMEIYKMLIIASQCIEMVGVPKIIISELSKVLETAFNNNIASIIKVKTMAEAPQFVNATSNNPEIYTYIDWLIQNAYQMSGVSQMTAAAKKPAGLDSGEAQRIFQDTQTQRFAGLERRYQNYYPDLAYKMIDKAQDLCAKHGSYSTVYPSKDGTREIDLPKAGMLKDTFVIQCFDESSLPRDPAGRQAKLSEMLAAQEITFPEFRKLSNFPDLEQSDQLAIALQERILHDLDSIIEDGIKGFNPPDEFILDPDDTATKLTVQTYNKYIVTDISTDRLDLLMDYFTQIQDLKAKAAPPPIVQPPPAGAPPQGAPTGPAPSAPNNIKVQPPAPSKSPTSGVAA